MRGAGLIVVGMLGGLALGCRTPDFACSDDEQCTLAAAGVCQATGHCSYPDSQCPSGQRFSEHAGGLAGECVEPSDAGSSDGTSSSSGTNTGPDDPCLDVDCGPNGRCEARGDEGICSCEPGFVLDGTTCVEEGCPGTRCLWVDVLDGDDANPGTRDAPIQTLARAGTLAPSLAPGEALVLRRGQLWDEGLALAGLSGDAEAPIVVAPYGPGDQANPRIGGGVIVEGSTGVRLQGLSINATGGPGLHLSGSSHVTVLECEVFEAPGGCIRIDGGSEYTAVVDSSAWECGTDTFGIALLQTGGGLGDHHWLLDTRVDGEGTINALHVTATAADDVKVVRNYLRGSIDRGLHSRIGEHGWLVGNVIAQAGDFNDAGFDHAGGGEVIARGNVVIDAALPVVLAGGGEWAFNTVLHRGTENAVTIPAGATSWSMHDNLVSAGDVAVLAVADATAVQTDDNVYVPGPAGSCTIDAEGMLVDLMGWQDGFGQDASSRCAPVPGLAIPETIGSTRDWDAAGLLEAVAPDRSWDGCGSPVGALDCEGAPVAAELPPFDDIGHGWEGPPEVRERVELVR